MNPIMLAQAATTAPPVAKATAMGFAVVVALACLGFLLVVWLLVAFCGKRICENCGHEPGVLIWIPILQTIPMVRAAGMSGWMAIVLFIPIIGYFFSIYVWWKLSEGCGKPGALGLLAIFPPLLIILIPLLAFTGSRPAPAQSA